MRVSSSTNVKAELEQYLWGNEDGFRPVNEMTTDFVQHYGLVQIDDVDEAEWLRFLERNSR